MAERGGVFRNYRRFMDDILVLAPICRRIRNAVEAANMVLGLHELSGPLRCGGVSRDRLRG